MPVEVKVAIGAWTWTSWTSLELDADYMVPASAWTVTARTPDAVTWSQLAPGLPVVIEAGGDVVLRGTLEAISSRRTKAGGLEVRLSGRDLAAALVDCGPGPSWAFPSTTLAATAQAAMAALGVLGTVEPSAEASTPISVRPETGESYWELLNRYAKRARLGLWMSPLGILRIGRPDYLALPVATLVNSRLVPASNNVLDWAYTRDVTQQRSPVTVVGQAGDSDFGAPVTSALGLALDADLVTLGLSRPLWLDDGEVGSILSATDRAREEVSRRRLSAERIEATVPGLFAAPATVWTPGQMVAVQDDIHGQTGLWWVRSRAIRMDQQSGTRTTLVLHPPNLYLPAV